MSNYTTQVRFICETNSNLDSSVGYNNIEQVLANSWNKIFDFDFPIFDEQYKKVLCIKILKHYYTREIGFETVGLWKLKLNTKLNEIMPYYNQLYKSELLEFNPLYDVNITRKRDNTHTDNLKNEKTKSGNDTTSRSGNDDIVKTGTKITDNELGGTSVTTTTGTNTNLYADTPTQKLDDIFPDNSSPNYLTNARKVNDSSSVETKPNTTSHQEETFSDFTDTHNYNIEDKIVYNTKDISQNSGSTIDDYLETVSGKAGTVSYAKMLQEYRQTFLNIDMLIIDELKDLFFKLW